MQHSLWKLAAVVGVSGLGFLVILQVQKGLHDPGMIQAAELDPATEERPAPASAEQTPPATARSANPPGIAHVRSEVEDPFAAADAAGLDFRESVPPADTTDGKLTPTAEANLKPVPESATPADPFAAIRPENSDVGTAADDEPTPIVPAGHEAENDPQAAATGPSGAMLAQAGDISDFGPDPFGPDPFGDLAPLTPDPSAAGLEEAPVDDRPTPSEQLDAADPFGTPLAKPAAAIDETEPADDPFAVEPAEATQSEPTQQPSSMPADDPFGPEPLEPIEASPADGSPVEPSPAAPASDDPFGSMPLDDDVPPGNGAADNETPATEPAESDPFGGAPPGNDPFGGDPSDSAGSTEDAGESIPDERSMIELPSQTEPVEEPVGESPATQEPAPMPADDPFGNDDPFDFGGPPVQPAPSNDQEPLPSDSLFDDGPTEGRPANNQPFDESLFDDAAPSDAPSMPTDTPRLLPGGEPAADPMGANAESPSSPRDSQKAELTVEKRAPGRAVIGEPLVYEIHVTNIGRSTAREVIVADIVPSGTDLIGTIPRAVEREGKLMWSLNSLEPGASKTIKVKVTPKEAGQIGSVATVDFVSEVAGTTKVVAPHLTLKVGAPSQVALGEPVDFQFEVFNDGSAPAERVMLRDLLPEGFEHADGNDLEYEVGTLPPGEKETVTLRVAAVKPGRFTNEVIVTAAGGVKTTATAEVAISSSPVTVSRRGPKQRYVGRPATYHNIVRNDSDRPARGVSVIETVPEGMDFVSASHSGQFDPDRRTVAWQIDSLSPGGEQTLQVVLTAATEGTQNSTVRVELAETAPVELASSTNVAQQPDLSPSLQGLDEPITVGERAAFRIHVRNRGDAQADGVTVGVRLPGHLKLVDARGGTVQADDAGRAIVRLTTPVPAGGEQAVDFVIESSAPGETSFRAEVNAPYMSSPLIKDQTLVVAPPRNAR